MYHNPSLTIETERMLLVPMTCTFVSKVLDNDVSAYEEYGVNLINEWPGADTKEIMPVIKEKLSYKSEPDGFNAWLFIDRQSNCIIGDGGFKDPPDHNGRIDIGYGIGESKRRQGYAYEAVSALIKWGFSQNGVKTISADCICCKIKMYKVAS